MSTRVGAVICLALGSSATHGHDLHPPPAYQRAALQAGIPPSVLFAVALHESGTTIRGRLEACAALRRALREYGSPEETMWLTIRVQCPRPRDDRNVDVGLGQISLRYHGHRVQEPCELLDPFRNLAIAATILREHHTPGNDWLVAIGNYHRPAGGEPAARYRRSVQRHLVRVVGAAVANPSSKDAR